MPLPIALVAALLLQTDAPAAPGLTVGGTIAVQRPAPTQPGRPAPTSAFAEATESALLDAGFIVIPHRILSASMMALETKAGARSSLKVLVLHRRRDLLCLSIA